MSRRLVQGVGLNDRKYPTTIDGKKCKEYSLWSDMLKRCYSKNHLADRPSYEGCTVSDNFKVYSYFYEWCHRQIGFGNVDWSLDKDILSGQNKQYSEDVCVFVPREINSFVVSITNKGEDIGVQQVGNKFRARIGIGKTKVHLGFYDSVAEATAKYLDAKRQICAELANTYKGAVDNRVYDTLMLYNTATTE